MTQETSLQNLPFVSIGTPTSTPWAIASTGARQGSTLTNEALGHSDKEEPPGAPALFSTFSSFGERFHSLEYQNLSGPV